MTRPQEAVQHADAEPQRLGRHPLVDAVEHRREVQVRRQPQRREAEAAHAQPLEATWRRCRRDIVYGTGRAPSSSARSAAAIASTSGAVEVVSTAWSWCSHSRTTPAPSSASSCRSNSSCWPGRKRPSTVARRRARDDVGLVAGVEHRRVGGVAQRRADHPGQPPSRATARASARSGSRSMPVELARRASRNARTVLVSTTGNSCRPMRATASASRVTALSSWTHRAVPGPAAGGQPQPGHALLRGLRSGRAAGRRGR